MSYTGGIVYAEVGTALLVTPTGEGQMAVQFYPDSDPGNYTATTDRNGTFAVSVTESGTLSINAGALDEIDVVFDDMTFDLWYLVDTTKGVMQYFPARFGDNGGMSWSHVGGIYNWNRDGLKENDDLTGDPITSINVTYDVHNKVGTYNTDKHNWTYTP